MSNKTYIAIDLNNAENKVMPILIYKALKHSEIPQNFGITNLSFRLFVANVYP